MVLHAKGRSAIRLGARATFVLEIGASAALAVRLYEGFLYDL